MSKDDLRFSLIDANTFEIATVQHLDTDTFIQRIVRQELQIDNFNKRVEGTKNEIQNHENEIIRGKAAIEQLQGSVQLLTSDLEKGYKFLELNHRGEVVAKIKAQVAEVKAAQEKILQQMTEQQQGQMLPPQ